MTLSKFLWVMRIYTGAALIGCVTMGVLTNDDSWRITGAILGVLLAIYCMIRVKQE